MRESSGEGAQRYRMTNRRFLYVCSDSTGETADWLAQATIRQFEGVSIRVRRYSQIRTADEIRSLLEGASCTGGMVVYTIVLPELREVMKTEAMRLGVKTVDVMGPMMQAFIDTYHVNPKRQPGLLHELDADYYRRMEAMEFAVKYDDGKDPTGMLSASVVIIGVSRTSKTPVSVYLAYKGVKAANLPILPEAKPPKELFEIDPNRIIGLTMNPEQLMRMRTERLRAIGLPDGAIYADPRRIQEELIFADSFMRKLGCNVIDVSDKSIEETAGMILGLL